MNPISIALLVLALFQNSLDWGKRDWPGALGDLRAGKNYSHHYRSKNVKCPLCEKSFFAATLGSYSTMGCELDLKIKTYVSANPYLFDLWMCPKCNYCALSWEFQSIGDIKKLQEALKKPQLYDSYFDIPYSVLLQKAELCYATKEYSDNKWGEFYLYGAWVARDSKRSVEEKQFHLKAQERFKRAVETEKGKEQIKAAYLIGEIERRYGSLEVAKKHLNRAEGLATELKDQDLLEFIEASRNEIQKASKK